MKIAYLMLALTLVAGAAMAANNASQNIGINVNHIAAMETSGPVSLVLEPPAEAGAAPIDTDDTTYLWYTSVIPASFSTGAEVSVALKTGGTLPAGTKLSLSGTDAVGGVGTVGTVVMTSPVKLTTSGGAFMGGVGSCYTGRGAGQGVKLKYWLEVENWVTVRAASGTETVVFTIQQ